MRGAGDAADDDDDDEDAAAAEGVCTALLAVVAAASATAPAGTCMYTSALFLRTEDACEAGDRVLPFSKQQNNDVSKKPYQLSERKDEYHLSLIAVKMQLVNGLAPAASSVRNKRDDSAFQQQPQIQFEKYCLCDAHLGRVRATELLDHVCDRKT